MHEESQLTASPLAHRSQRTSLVGTRLGALDCLSNEERSALENAVTLSRTIEAGNTLIREGEATDRLYFLVDGWAYRFKTTSDGGRQIVSIAVPGDAANLDALMFERPDYGVRALSKASVLAIPRTRAAALAAEHAGIAKAFTLLAMLEFKVLSQWALCLGRLSAQQRLAHLIAELSVRLACEDGNRSHFEMPLTQEQLADCLGLTSVHVNRTLQQLRSDELIVTGSRRMSIPDVARLRQAGSFHPSYLCLQPLGDDAVLIGSR